MILRSADDNPHLHDIKLCHAGLIVHIFESIDVYVSRYWCNEVMGNPPVYPGAW